MKKKKTGFIRGASILAFATIASKLIGALYRIPLTNILGAEGMGVYQLVFPLYALILTSSSGALPQAVSILTSRKHAAGDYDGAKSTVSSSAIVMGTFGIIFMGLMAALAYPLSLLQHNTDAVLGYLAIAPAVLFVSGISVLRGWFQGKHNMVPSAWSNVSEAAVKLVAGLLLAWLLRPLGIKWCVFGALIGVTLSEAATFIILYLRFRKEDGELVVKTKWRDAKAEYKEILAFSIPMTVCAVIASFTQFIDSILVVNFLSRLGTPVADATAAYGLFSGPVSSLISLPVVLGIALSVAIVPAVAKDKEERNLYAIKAKSATAVKVAVSVGIPFAVFFLVAAEGIINLLYPAFSEAETATAATLLRIGSASAVTLLCGQIFMSVLQALGELQRPIKNYAVAAVIKVGAELVLMPFIGIYGVAAASMISNLAAMIMNAASLRVLSGKPENLSKITGVVAVSGAIMSSIMLLIVVFLHGVWGAVAAGVAGFSVYAVMWLTLKALDDKELVSLPFGEKLLKLRNKLRFWEERNSESG